MTADTQLRSDPPAAVTPKWDLPGYEHLRPPLCSRCDDYHVGRYCRDGRHRDDFRPYGQPDQQPGDRLGQLRDALLDTHALDSLPDPEPVIGGLLYRDSLAWLHGKPGCGKSFVALDWSSCIAAGLPWQATEVTPGPVLYIVAEGVTGLRARVRAWEDYAAVNCGVTFLPVPVQFLSPVDVAALAALAAEIEPVLVVVDTQARVAVGADENSAKDMGELVAAADRIRAASRACVLLVHHEPRAGENMRGSTALEGAATTILRCEKDGPRLLVTNPKQKDAAEADPIRLRLVPRLGSAIVLAAGQVTEDLSDSERAIVATLADAFGETGAPSGRLREFVMSSARISEATFYRALTRLASAGQVVNVGSKTRPHYLLPDLVPQGVTHE